MTRRKISEAALQKRRKKLNMFQRSVCYEDLGITFRKTLLENALQVLENRKIIGLCGFHQVGKSTAALQLSKMLKNRNKSAKLELINLLDLAFYSEAMAYHLQKIKNSGSKFGDIVIVDEATALRLFASDTNETKQFADEILKVISEGCNVIVIYHRISDARSFVRKLFGITDECIVPSILPNNEVIAEFDACREIGIEFSQNTINRIIEVSGRHVSVLCNIIGLMLMDKFKDIYDKHLKLVNIDVDPDPYYEKTINGFFSGLGTVFSSGIYDGLSKCLTKREKRTLQALVYKTDSRMFVTEIEELKKYGIIEKDEHSVIVGEPIERYVRSELRI